MSEEKKSRLLDFRKRNKKIDEMNEHQTQQDSRNTMALMIGLSKRLFDLEKKVGGIIDHLDSAKKADYRSLAIQRILDRNKIITQKMIEEEADAISVEYFEDDSKRHDLAYGLEVVIDKPAEEGMYAIFSLKLFKDGAELEDQFSPRGKVEIGKGEQFPELDTAIVGMNIGDISRIKCNIMQQTDEIEVTLLGLRQKGILRSNEEKNKEAGDQGKEI